MNNDYLQKRKILYEKNNIEEIVIFDKNHEQIINDISKNDNNIILYSFFVGEEIEELKIFLNSIKVFCLNYKLILFT